MYTACQTKKADGSIGRMHSKEIWSPTCLFFNQIRTHNVHSLELIGRCIGFSREWVGFYMSLCIYDALCDIFTIKLYISFFRYDWFSLIKIWTSYSPHIISSSILNVKSCEWPRQTPWFLCFSLIQKQLNWHILRIEYALLHMRKLWKSADTSFHRLMKNVFLCWMVYCFKDGSLSIGMLRYVLAS